MSRVLPPLDINVPPSADGSKKFKRVRPVEGAVATATTATTVTTTTTTSTPGYISMNPTVTPASAKPVIVQMPTATASIVSPTLQKPILAHNSTPYIPSDMAIAAASAFDAPPIVSTPTPASTGNGASTGSTTGTTKKSRKKRKGGSGSTGAVATDAAGSIQTPMQGGATLYQEDLSGTKKAQQNNSKKRKKGQNANNQSGTDLKKQQHEKKNNKVRRKNRQQILIRNLDATPELVGVSAEEDFSTLLVKHVEHSNKMLQRDLEKQSKMMMEEQKKQAKLLATQAAQLSNPQAAQQSLEQQQQQQQQQPQQQQQQQQQQQKKNLQNKNKTPFIPRKDCIYFLRGYCRHGEECTFKHDVEARDAHQAQLSEGGPDVVSTMGSSGDLAQVAMYAM
ncbi:hypothetical protein BGX21_006345 [Mortierella sp. AD011]|nr:hypothetical protein BGX20_008583 [Mortierella sp. AD010]KAF9399382.1 hypothetical protein BGX21_006345 [Mortierella sp. AD011]